MNASSESFFQTIFNHLTQPMVVVRADAPRFTIVACNEQYKRISNTANKNITGKGIREVHAGYEINTTGDNIIQQALEKAILNKTTVRLEAVRYDLPVAGTNETEQSWWQAEYMPIAGLDGETEYLLCTIHDITQQVIDRELMERLDIQERALQREKALTIKLTATNEELYQSQRRLGQLNNELEERVFVRTHALAQSEDNFRNIILQAPVAMGFFTGEEMMLQVINDKFLELWNRSRDIVGKTVLEALPEMKDQPYYSIMQRVLATGEPYYGNEEKVMLHRNGRMEEGYYNFINHPYKNAEGKNTGVIVVAVEVTAEVLAKRKQQEVNEELAAKNEEIFSINEELAAAQVNLEELISELTESEARLTRFFMQAPAGICVLDGPDLIFELVNPSYQQLFPGRNLLGKPILEAVPEVKDQSIWNILQHVYHTGKTFEGNSLLIPLARYDHGPIEERYFNFIYQARLNASGVVDGILVFVFEVTDQAMASKRIEQTEALLRLAVEAADIGTWYLDINTRAFIASDRFKELYGYRAEDVISIEDAVRQIPEGYRQQVTDAIEQAITKGEIYRHEHSVVGYHDRELRWVKAVGSLTKDPEGRFSYFSGVSMDITEQKNDEIRKNDFISMVSHELKTPLTSLKAYTQLVKLRVGKSKDDLSMDMLANIEKQVNKMTNIVNGFLNVTRLESGKIHLDKRSFNLNDLVKESIEEVKAMMQCDNIDFLPCISLIVHADYEKIGQVINNLLNNAVKYSDKSKRIEVRCRQADGTAEVSIKDEGVGIQPEHLDKLFNRFYRVENGANKFVSGFGIGLYLSAEIVRRHNGHIWAESEVGKGSTFYFSLPL